MCCSASAMLVTKSVCRIVPRMSIYDTTASMPRSRRSAQIARFACVAAFAMSLAGCGRTGETRRVITLVTHSSPGGGSDVFLREMVPHLTRVMGGTFVVENIQGGSGAKAMATIAKAKPTAVIFYATTPTFIYTSLLSRPAARYSDLEPLVNLFFDPEVLYTAADSRFTSLADVLAITPGQVAASGAPPTLPRSSGK